MDVRVGDILELKKPHPCGSHQMKVLRIGMDFRLQCLGCSRDMMVPRARIERYVRAIRRDAEDGNV